MIVSAKVVPVNPVPLGTRPVHRGYWALAGFSGDGTNAGGLFLPAYLTNARVTAVRDACRNPLIAANVAVQANPIRVGRPTPAGVRATGLVADTVIRPEVSTRGSRKVGRGA
jgi:hypothetical protein